MVEKDTIAIAELFQRSPSPDFPCVLILEFVAAQIDSSGHGFDFRVVDPDKARRTGAAVATS